jgi:hypothetical protein
VDSIEGDADEQAARRRARQEIDHLDDVEAAMRYAEHVGELGPAQIPRLTGILNEIDSRRSQARPDTFGLKVYPSTPPEQRMALFPGLKLEAAVEWRPLIAQGPPECI